jgi:hypothetical protein
VGHLARAQGEAVSEERWPEGFGRAAFLESAFALRVCEPLDMTKWAQQEFAEWLWREHMEHDA